MKSVKIGVYKVKFTFPSVEVGKNGVCYQDYNNELIDILFSKIG